MATPQGGIVNDIDSKEINQALPVRHPMYLGIEAVIATGILEVVAVAITRVTHWPWWIAFQLPIVYLLWKWSRERRFAHRLAGAWNKKRDVEVELSRQLREALRRSNGTP
jgi:hypothetical protein